MSNYDAQNALAVFAGIPLTSAWAKGAFLKLEQTGDSYAINVGSTGEIVRTRLNDRSAMATATLSGGALVNDALSAILEIDRSTNAGVAPFMLKDLNSIGLATAPNAWIKKPPSYDFGGDELPNREWPLQLDDYQTFIGGQLT